MSTLTVGNGALFWAYVSPSNDTAANVTDWSVTIEQQGGNWIGKITSENPREQLQTPNLSGHFTVTVWGSGPKMAWQQLEVQQGSNPDIGCNSNCAAMVGIVSNEGGTGANYWTVSDAFCSK